MGEIKWDYFFFFLLFKEANLNNAHETESIWKKTENFEFGARITIIFSCFLKQNKREEISKLFLLFFNFVVESIYMVTNTI